MSDKKQSDELGPLILFPEVTGISILALLLPVPLVHMLLSGQVFMGIIGFVFWFAALFFAVRFVRRRQHGLVWLPMLVMVGLFLIIKKLSN